MQTNKYIKGLVTGACVGLAVSSIINPVDKRDMKRMNNKANKAWTTVGSMIDGVVSTFN